MPEAFDVESDCPVCHGDGFIVLQATPVFNAREEQWYPTEDERPCPKCH
jgi:RecJ-like exonuclease